MRIDTDAFVGAYPWRRVDATPGALLAAMDRTGITQAWCADLSAIFWRDPTEGNEPLYRLAAAEPRIRPVPAVHPGLPEWERVLDRALEAGAPVVRADPGCYGLDPAGAAMRRLAAACGERAIPLALTVKLEDLRQRHPNDAAPDLPAHAVRALVRSDPSVRLLVLHADRAFVEEVHFGSMPDESARIWWDFAWIWGPPEDHLELLLATVGPERFVLGTGQPLRLPENPLAKLDLLDLDPAVRAALEAGNAAALTRRG